jgi:hypothetical protein
MENKEEITKEERLPKHCIHCKFWHITPETAECMKDVEIPDANKLLGSCLRFPPVPVADKGCFWPVTSGLGVCGEYRQKQLDQIPFVLNPQLNA